MKKALIVGLNDYPNSKLEWCDNDAIAMKELIESNGDGSPNFDVVSIIDSCTKNNLKAAIGKLFVDDADIALLYFSGHGTNIDGGYLCTTDFSESDYGVRMTDVLEMANKSHCKNKIIILDCCFAAKMGETILLNNNSVLGEGVTIIAASQSWQTSAENGAIQHGVFTELLIQGLKGGAADIGGNITPASLYSFVVVLCQDLVQVKMSFSHSNLPAIPKLPVDTILQNHRVTYNRNDYEFVWYYKTFPSIQIPGGMHVCNC